MIPCKICKQPTDKLGTRLCDPCWEVTNRLEGFLRRGREHAASFVRETFANNGIELVNISQALEVLREFARQEAFEQARKAVTEALRDYSGIMDTYFGESPTELVTRALRGLVGAEVAPGEWTFLLKEGEAVRFADGSVFSAPQDRDVDITLCGAAMPAVLHKPPLPRAPANPIEVPPGGTVNLNGYLIRADDNNPGSVFVGLKP